MRGLSLAEDEIVVGAGANDIEIHNINPPPKTAHRRQSDRTEHGRGIARDATAAYRACSAAVGNRIRTMARPSAANLGRVLIAKK